MKIVKKSYIAVLLKFAFRDDFRFRPPYLPVSFRNACFFTNWRKSGV